jgi:hypothetical protein
MAEPAPPMPPIPCEPPRIERVFTPNDLERKSCTQGSQRCPGQ